MNLISNFLVVIASLLQTPNTMGYTIFQSKRQSIGTVHVPSAFLQLQPKAYEKQHTSTVLLMSGGDGGDGGNHHMDEEALLEYLDQDDLASGITFQEYKEQQRREKYLRESPLFQSCSNLDLSRIAKAMVLQNFKKGEKIVKQGDSGSEMYFLKKGCVQALKAVNGTEEILVTYSDEGSAFGELALLFDQPRVASVVAIDDTVLYRLDKAAFLDSLVDTPIWETAKGIILKKYKSSRLSDVLFKVRLDEILGLLRARLLGRFSKKRLAKTIATFSMGSASVLITTTWPIPKPGIPLLYLALGLVSYIVN